MTQQASVEESQAPAQAPSGVLEHGAARRIGVPHLSLDVLIEHQLDFIVALDGAACISYASPSVERAFGYRTEELIGRPLLEFVHPDDAERVTGFIGRYLSQPGRIPPIEARIVAEDGTWRRLEAIANNLLNDPTVRSVVVNARDVTERTEIDQTLRAAEERYRSLVESAPAVAYVWQVGATAGRAAYYTSPQIQELLGYTAEEWDSDQDRWELSVHPDDREWVLEATRASSTGGVTFVEDYRYISKDGRTIWVHDEARLHERDAEGRPHLFHGVMTDITERKSAEEALRHAEALYRTLIEQLPAATYLDRIDTDGGGYTPLYISPQIESMLGFARSEWLETTEGWDSRWVHPDDVDALVQATESAVARRQPLSAEYRMKASDGREVWVHEDSQPVGVDGSGALLRQGVMYDITERKRAEQMLRESEAELQRGLEVLQRTDVERRQLLAHLLRAENLERERMAEGIEDHSLQHVAALGMRLETMRRNVDDPEQLGALDAMGETVEGAMGRLRHLLVELRPRALEQEGLGAGLRQYLRGVEADTGTAVTFLDGTTRELELDTRVIAYRIAQEAVGNAVRYAEASSVNVTLEDAPGGVLVRVADDGRGFEPEGPGAAEQDVVASMRERATLVGGRLDVHSGIDGTVVEFWLPTGTEQPGP
jgi:PAS domain S-box-containing protein